jgi:thioredoxin reductase
VNLIGRSPRRNGFRNVAEWRHRQLEKLQVPIRLNTEVTPALVKQIVPDVIVLATGSTPRRVRYPGSDLPHVFTASDVMEGRLARKRHVVVVDASNYYQGTDPVEYLAARGTKVTVVTALPIFAAGASMNDGPVLLESLKDKDVTFHLNSEISGITATTVDCLEVVNVPWGAWYYGGRKRAFSIEGADAVVLAIGADPDAGLWNALASDTYEIHRIGDCLAPRGVEHAVYEGHKVAWTIGDTNSEVA